MTLAWFDCASGVSGDMLLGALVDAGVPIEVLQEAVDAVVPEPVALRTERVTRGSLAATRVHVEGTDSVTHRTWTDVRALLGTDRAGRVPGIERARDAFAALAAAEGHVHGVPAEEVHFHEVGALDAVADVVGACAGLAHLGVEAVHVSPVALGGGTVRAAHGRMSVPGPAVVRLLADAPTYGGPVDVELATPTGAAVLVAHATAWGPQPPLTGTTQGLGAGGRDLAGHANVLRLVVGSPWVATDDPGTALVLETNVDDLDPRVWPAVIAALLAAGASDAWLSPIVMKKGRPAHTLHVLTRPQQADAVRATVFEQTSAIGLREQVVRKHALDREVVTVQVDGQPVRVKTAGSHGRVLNAQPEWDDVAAAAAALDRPVKTVLAQAISAYHQGVHRT